MTDKLEKELFSEYSKIDLRRINWLVEVAMIDQNLASQLNIITGRLDGSEVCRDCGWRANAPLQQKTRELKTEYGGWFLLREPLDFECFACHKEWSTAASTEQMKKTAQKIFYFAEMKRFAGLLDVRLKIFNNEGFCND